MSWKHVNAYGAPTDDGEYLVAYRGPHTGKWQIMLADFEDGKFDCDHSPPYVEWWMSIPDLPA